MTLERADPNRKVLLEGKTYNKLAEAADRVLGGEFSRLSGLLGQSPTRVKIRNKSGAPLDRWWVVGIDVATITPPENQLEFENVHYFDGIVPTTDHLDKFAIIQEPIDTNATGFGIAIGVSTAFVNMTDETHTHATAIDGDPTKLESSETGFAKILHVEPGTGVKIAKVVIRGGGGPGRVDIVRIDDVSIPDCQDVPRLSECIWEGKVVHPTAGDQCGDPFTDGEDIWIVAVNKCTPPTVLKKAERYLAHRLADEHMFQSTTKPLYAIRESEAATDSTKIVTPVGTLCRNITRDAKCLFDGRETTLDTASADMCDKFGESATKVWIITMNSCPQQEELMEHENYLGRHVGVFDPGGDSRPMYAVDGTRETHRFVSVVDEVGQDCKTLFGEDNAQCLFDGRIHSLDMSSADLCDRWSEGSDPCWILTMNSCPAIQYLNKTDRFLGRYMGNFDPGTDDRPVYVIDGNRTHIVPFTLTAALPLSPPSTATATWDGGPPSPDDQIIVHDPHILFPRTKIGSKGYACRDVEGRYLVMNVQQIARFLLVWLDGDMRTGFNGVPKPDASPFQWEILDKSPFILKPPSIGDLWNNFNLEAADGERVLIGFNESNARWIVLQAEHRKIRMVETLTYNTISGDLTQTRRDIVCMGIDSSLSPEFIVNIPP